MITAFVQMLIQAFSAITKYFIAFEKTANATVHLATWADETAGAFADAARIKRQAELNALLKDAKLTAKQTAALE